MVDERKARRQRQRRQIRRQRMLAAGSLVVALLAIVAFVVSAGGSASGNRGRGLSRKKGQKSTASDLGSSASGKARNATPQPDWAPYTGPVPILEYHMLGAAPADEPYPDLYVSRPDFHKQMNWLDEHGYEAVTLEQVEAA
jgi:hypothetical protein